MTPIQHKDGCGECEGTWQDCWQCGGEGGFHDCGEDCCPCLDKEEPTRDCDICRGEGGYLICWMFADVG